jgi:hypothetical protein
MNEAPQGRLTSHNRVATSTKIGTDTFVRSLVTDVELRFDQGEESVQALYRSMEGAGVRVRTS